MINRKNLSDYSSLKKPNKDGEIIKEYTSIKLKTEPTELQKYYEYLTKSQSVLDEVNYVADRMKREDLETLRQEYLFLEKLKADREKEISKDAVKVIKGEIVNNEDITPTIQTPMELEQETFSTDLSAKMDKSNEDGEFEKRINKFKQAVEERQRKKEEKKASSVLQGAIRGKKAREEFKQQKEASSVLQEAIRGKQERNKFEKAKKGITEFQRVVRGQQERKRYDDMLEYISQATTQVIGETPNIEDLKKLRKERSDKGVKRGSYKKK